MNGYCYGPAVEVEGGQDPELETDEGQQTLSPQPAISPATAGMPAASSSQHGGADVDDASETASPTANPKETHLPASWLRWYGDNEASAPARISFYCWVLVLLPNFFSVVRW